MVTLKRFCIVLIFLCSAQKSFSSSGVFFLTIQEKEQSTVCGIGDAQAQNFPKTHFVEEEKELFLNFLEKLAQKNEIIGFPLLKTRANAKDLIDFTLAEQKRKPANHFPLSTTLMQIAVAQKYRNIDFSFLDPELFLSKLQLLILNYLSFFHSDVFGMILLALSSEFNCLLSDVTAVDRYLSQHAQEKARFFSSQGKFQNFEKIIIQTGKSHTYTAAEYIKDLDTCIERLQSRAAENDAHLRALLADIIDLYKQHKKKASSFFTQYSDPKKKSRTLCIQIFLNCIKAKQSFCQAVEEFQLEVSDICNKIGDLFVALGLYNALKKHNKVLFIAHHMGMMPRLLEYLQKWGYKGEREGLLSSATAGLHLVESRNFTAQQLQDFFDNLFSRNIMPKCASNQKMLYYERKTGALQTVPTLDYTEVPCSECKRSVAHCHLYAQSSELSQPSVAAAASSSTSDAKGKKAYCTVDCFLKNFISEKSERSRALQLLTTTTPLSAEESLLLQQIAALCLYQYMMLLENASSESGQFYQLPHAVLAELFTRLQSLASCKVMRMGLEPLGINLLKLKIFFEIYHKFKQQYRREIFERVKTTSFTNLDENMVVLFDSENYIKKLQESATTGLNTHFGLAADTKRTALAQLYYELVERIVQRLPAGQTNFTDSLVIQQKDDRDLQEVLAQLGETTKEALNKKNKHKVTKAPSKPSTADVSDECLSESDDEEAPMPLITREDEHPAEEYPADEYPALSKIDEIVTNAGKVSVPVIPKRTPIVVKEISGNLIGKEDYRIQLFNARKLISFDKSMEEAHDTFQKCKNFRDDFRVKIIFTLADFLKTQKSTLIIRNAYGRLALQCSDTTIDPSYIEKLNIDHLFSREADRHLKSFGIIESKGDRITVSIPGKIMMSDGSFFVGFFQYSFVKDSLNKYSWLLIHRCFVNHNANIDGSYVSKVLRQALLDFLKMHIHDNSDYTKIIQDLERLISN